MAWYSDEQWEYMQDCKDKSITARSARSTRSHCGKGGKVKLPSDYMTKKELKSMNGECKSYRLNAPMSWEGFLSLPDDLKVVYIKALREKYKVPTKVLAKAMGVSESKLTYHIKVLGLSQGKGAGAAGRHWHNTENSVKFWAWWHGVKEEALHDDEETDIPEKDAEEKDANEILDLCAKLVDIPEDPHVLKPAEPILDSIISTANHLPVIPKRGTIAFDNNLADDALDTIKTILSNVRVNLTVSWECVFEEE